MARKKKKSDCDLGHHRLFETRGGDQLCQACGFRKKGGLTLKEEGMEKAESADDIQTWKANFTETVEACALSGKPFTSEHIIAMIGLPREDVQMNANNAVGAMMNGAAKRGVIEKTGRRVLSKRPTSHGAELTEWIGK